MDLFLLGTFVVSVSSGPASPSLSNPAPVVVVGAGPVGVRCVQLLHERDPGCRIVLYGREPWDPYNRVQLSSFLTGESAWSDLARGLELPDAPVVERRLHCAVIGIDRTQRHVHDSHGRCQPYGTLVLATGSRARVPDLPGIGQANVFVFRDLSDTQALFARRTRSVCTVVLGGGLLGLEAARAMQRFNTRVIVVEHADRLMARQLDARGSRALHARLAALGIEVRTGAAVRALRGHGRVTGVELRSGELLSCDTVVVATGIVPNVDLALDCGIGIGRGIRVDDAMTTTDPHVLAIGECAEHRGQVYGLVAPGLEQAAVAVHTALGGSARYTGSLASTRLKVVGLPVFSIGTIDASQSREPLRSVPHTAPDTGAYRAVMLERGRLVGAIAIGASDDTRRLQEAVLERRRVWPWQRWRWQRSGRLWAAGAARSVVDWPADAVVCQCNQVTRGRLSIALAGGCDSVAALATCTRASTVCGSCRPLLAEMVGHGGTPAAPAAPVRGWRPLASGAAMGVLLALGLLVLPGWAYMETVQGHVSWQRIWSETLWKQWSGYGVLALTSVGLLLSLRKRLVSVRIGHFDVWRVAHVLSGFAALLLLAVHTGARMGARIDFALMSSFVGLVAIGGIAAGVIAFEHRLQPALVRRWRQLSVWTHIVLFWPVPLLLTFHVLKSYWF